MDTNKSKFITFNQSKFISITQQDMRETNTIHQCELNEPREFVEYIQSNMPLICITTLCEISNTSCETKIDIRNNLHEDAPFYALSKKKVIPENQDLPSCIYSKYLIANVGFRYMAHLTLIECNFCLLSQRISNNIEALYKIKLDDKTCEAINNCENMKIFNRTIFRDCSERLDKTTKGQTFPIAQLRNIKCDDYTIANIYLLVLLLQVECKNCIKKQNNTKLIYIMNHMHGVGISKDGLCFAVESEEMKKFTSYLATV